MFSCCIVHFNCVPQDEGIIAWEIKACIKSFVLCSDVDAPRPGLMCNELLTLKAKSTIVQI